MPSEKGNNELVEIMAIVFPGYENFKLDSVTPAITGGDRLSFMIVCNEEAAKAFMETDEIYAQVFLDFQESEEGQDSPLNLRFEFLFPTFKLEFYATIEGENILQQQAFARVLKEVDRYMLWIVDEDKNIIKILQVAWDIGDQMEIVEKVLADQE